MVDIQIVLVRCSRRPSESGGWVEKCLYEKCCGLARNFVVELKNVVFGFRSDLCEWPKYFVVDL